MGALTEAISQVGKGVSKAKHLNADAARTVMDCMLSGAADPFELGALLVALRIKEETAEELTAFTQSAQAYLTPVPGPAARLTVASYAGKRQTFPALLSAACTLAACGVTVGLHGHATPPERRSMAEVIRALGGNPDATPDQAADDLARAGVAYVGVEQFLPRMHEMLELRRRMGLRSCFHTMARLVNPFSATRQMVGVSHARTFTKLSQAAHGLGFERVVSFRGMEGEAEPNPLTATEGTELLADGTLQTYSIDPAALGLATGQHRSVLMVDTPAAAADMVRAALDGSAAPGVIDAVALNAALGAYAAGLAPTLMAAMGPVRAALQDGSANARLDAWIAR